jgi:hypothetical protein
MKNNISYRVACCTCSGGEHMIVLLVIADHACCVIGGVQIKSPTGIIATTLIISAMTNYRHLTLPGDSAT